MGHIKKGFVDSLNGMALGLFSSLILGLILDQLGSIFHLPLLNYLGEVSKRMMGPAIGAGIAYVLKAPPLGSMAAVIAGALGAQTILLKEGLYLVVIGEPAGAYVASVVAVLVSKFVAGKTKVDIVVVPFVSITLAGLAATHLSPLIAQFLTMLGALINHATLLQPFLMGILVSVLMGMMLTLPISSAAIAISLGLSGLAAGAATVGCACQMVGFAVISYKENKFGGLLAQGLGTSMLQLPNIVRNPWIWVPPTLASALLGPVSTLVFKMENTKTGAGMGTSGLVGQLGTIEAMGTSAIVPILLLHFILPAILSLVIAQVLRKKNRIKDQDLLLPKL